MKIDAKIWLEHNDKANRFRISLKFNGLGEDVLGTLVHSVVVRYAIILEVCHRKGNPQEQLLCSINKSRLQFKRDQIIFSVSLPLLLQPDVTVVRIESLILTPTLLPSKNRRERVEIALNITLHCAAPAPNIEEKSLEVCCHWLEKAIQEQSVSDRKTECSVKDLIQLYQSEPPISHVDNDIFYMIVDGLYVLLKFFLEIKMDAKEDLTVLVSQFFQRYILERQDTVIRPSPFIDSYKLIGETLGN